MFAQQLSLFLDWKPLTPNQNEKNKYVEQKCRDFGLEHCVSAQFCGKYGIPFIPSYKGDIPQSYITYSEIGNGGNPETCVTFFNYDYVIERFWSNPDKYLPVLAMYKCAAEPDFSLKANASLAVQIANTFRNHVLAHKMVTHGIPVIPSMSWSTPQSFEFCFDGHERGGVVMVSTLGIYHDERSFMYFRRGFKEMLKHISPEALIVIGDVSEQVIQLMPTQLDVHYFQNNRILRMRSYGR